jgi:hypothetical protein
MISVKTDSFLSQGMCNDAYTLAKCGGDLIASVLCVCAGILVLFEEIL